jgi:hypothetical protein
MKEADLYPAVKAWLEGQRLKAYPEVPLQHRPIDVVGIGDAVTVGIEMKRHMSQKVIYQAATLSLSCDRSYVAVGSKPRSLEQARRLGIGVLRVAKGMVEVLLESAHQGTPTPHYRDQLRTKCARMTGEGVGGVPCLDGVGPAQDCKRRVEAYKKENPEAGWGEIWLKVPNHYASAKSMAGALTTSLKMRALFKERRRKRRAEERKADAERRGADGEGDRMPDHMKSAWVIHFAVFRNAPARCRRPAKAATSHWPGVTCRRCHALRTRAEGNVREEPTDRKETV